MTIAFLTNDLHGIHNTPGGCAYYRCWLPMSVTNAHLGRPAFDPIRGFGIQETPHHGIFGYKTISLKLIMHRWTPHQIRLAQNLGQRIIVDIDDHYEGLTESNKAWTESHPDTNPNNNRDHYYDTIMAADAVTVSTPFLHNLWSTRRDNVTLIRNSINPQQFTPKHHLPGTPVIGWVGSTSYRSNDLEQLRDWLPELTEKYDLHVHHSGHAPNTPTFAELTQVDPKRITTSPLVPITRYAEGFTFDIGLVPLNDIPFNHAKSNIKGLEYASAGIPFIASDLPEYRLLHEAGIGRLAATPDDWTHNITQLLNPAARRSEGTRIRKLANTQWSIDTKQGEWDAALAS